jgi:hypothetical protein
MSPANDNRMGDYGAVVRNVLASRDVGEPPECDWRELRAVLWCRHHRRQGDWEGALGEVRRATEPGLTGKGVGIGHGELLSYLDRESRRLGAAPASPGRGIVLNLLQAERQSLRQLVHRLRYAAGLRDARDPVPAPETQKSPIQEAFVLALYEYDVLRNEPPRPTSECSPRRETPLSLVEHVRRARNLLLATVPEWVADHGAEKLLTGERAGKSPMADLGGYEGAHGLARQVAAHRAPMMPPAMPPAVGLAPTIDTAARLARLAGLACGWDARAQYAVAAEHLIRLLEARPPTGTPQPMARTHLAHLAMAVVEGLELQKLAGVPPEDLPSGADVWHLLSSLGVARSMGAAQRDGNHQGDAP